MNRFFIAAMCLAGALPAVAPRQVTAAILTVTNTASTGPGTLDEAIGNANSNAGDVITFAISLPATIVLPNHFELIETNMTIAGPGADQLTISGDGTNFLFGVNVFVTATISGVTLSNGVSSSDLVDPLGGGGAIINIGTLTLSACSLKNNLARGGIGHSPGGGGGAGGGGAIINGDIAGLGVDSATLFVVNSTFSDNQALGGAGDQAGGGSGAGMGGAIFNANGLVVLSNCTFAANSAVGGTSGISNDGQGFGDGGDGLDIEGGGLGNAGSGNGSSGEDGNTGGGGGSGSDGLPGFGVCDGGNGGGGGLGGFGGGAGAGGPGTDGCVVTNVTDMFEGGNGGNGGGGGNGGFGGGGGGAGIGGQPTGAGTLTGAIGTSGVAGLSAGSGVSTNGGGGAGFGGAIFNYALSTTLMFNCTITSNSAVGGGSAGHVADGSGTGGGIYNFDGFVTGLGSNAGGTVQMLNTILANNSADSAVDAGGTITSEGHNLVGIVNGSSGLVNGVEGDQAGSTTSPLNPGLGLLANNGGPTFTVAILPSSPAVNGGADVGCAVTDQRGVTRPQIVNCDIGAFELADTAPTALCHNVAVSVTSNCSANASIDNGSFDSDPGDSITLSQSPAGPYPVGTTTVTLTVTDHHGETNSCAATVTVNDTVLPTIVCQSNLTVSATSSSGAIVSFGTPTVIGGCDTTITSSPVSGTNFAIGNTTVTWTAADAHGLTNTCTFVVHVKTAAESVIDAENSIDNLDLSPKLSKQITQKLNSINKQLQRSKNTKAACKQLLNLIRTTEKDLDKGVLTEDQAIQITTPLSQILTIAGCS